MAKKTVNLAKKASKLSKFRKFEPVIKRIFLVAIGLYLSLFALEFTKNYTIQVKLKSEVEETATLEPANSSVRIMYKIEPRPKYWFYMARGKVRFVFVSSKPSFNINFRLHVDFLFGG